MKPDIQLLLKLIQRADRTGKEVLLTRSVDWSFLPTPGNDRIRISIGLDESGEPTGWSVGVEYIWFCTENSIIVELDEEKDLREQYSQFLEDAKRDGFVEYGS